MATTLFLKSKYNSGPSLTGYQYASATRSVLALATSVTNTTSSGTKIQATQTGGGTAIKWISPPVSLSVVISSTVTFQLWAKEAATGNNAGIRMELVQYTGGAEGSVFAAATFGAPTELTTTMASKNWTVSPTQTTLAPGDRVVAYIYVVNVGTMGAGTPGVTVDYAGPTAAADGEAFFQFTETVTFETEPEFIQSGSGTTTATSLAVTLPGVSATGNMLICQSDQTEQIQTLTIADNKSNGHTVLWGPSNWNTERDYWWYSKNITGGGAAIQTTITRSGSSAFLALAVYEWSGLDQTEPLDVKGGSDPHTGNSTLPLSGTATPSVVNSLWIGVGDWAGSAPTVTPTSPYVSREPATVFFITIDKYVKSAPASGTAGMTINPSQQWVYALAIFKCATQPALDEPEFVQIPAVNSDPQITVFGG